MSLQSFILAKSFEIISPLGEDLPDLDFSSLPTQRTRHASMVCRNKIDYINVFQGKTNRYLTIMHMNVVCFNITKPIMRIIPRDHLCNSQNRNICLFLFFSSFSHQLAVLSCDHALQYQMLHLQIEAFCLSITELCA